MGDACSLGRLSAAAEARGLLPLLQGGNTVEQIRDVIAVPEQIEKRLRAFVKAYPGNAHWIESSLKSEKPWRGSSRSYWPAPWR